MLVLLLSACAGSEKESSDPPPLATDDTAEDCGGTPPVIDALTVSDGGEQTSEGVTFRALLVSADAHDVDSDIDRMKLDIWLDETVDGTVDTSGDPAFAGGYIVIRDLPCGVGTGGIGSYLPITGGRLSFATTYEFAGIVTDVHQFTSDAVIITGTTPTE